MSVIIGIVRDEMKQAEVSSMNVAEIWKRFAKTTTNTTMKITREDLVDVLQHYKKL
jgi:hypothetical protein